MRNYKVKLTGTNPLLMHHDNIEWADYMEDWKNDPENKKLSKAGDDRTPAWRWLGCVYHDGTELAIPQANIMRSLMEGGTMVLVPSGGGKKTFKAQTQSGMMSAEAFWPLFINGYRLPWSKLESLKDVPRFTDHKRQVRELEFDLLVKRARIGQSKHIRVRPVFAAGWELSGVLSVWDEQITDEVLAQIIEYAGRYKGIGDWRPGSKTPGPYGMFEGVVESI